MDLAWHVLLCIAVQMLPMIATVTLGLFVSTSGFRRMHSHGIPTMTPSSWLKLHSQRILLKEVVVLSIPLRAIQFFLPLSSSDFSCFNFQSLGGILWVGIRPSDCVACRVCTYYSVSHPLHFVHLKHTISSNLSATWLLVPSSRAAFKCARFEGGVT